MKDLGVLFDSHLKFALHISEKINKTYSILGIIRRNFSFLNKHSFLAIYKSMARSHLEYANCIWSPHIAQDKKNLEKVQMRATKLSVGQRYQRGPSCSRSCRHQHQAQALSHLHNSQLPLRSSLHYFLRN